MNSTDSNQLRSNEMRETTSLPHPWGLEAYNFFIYRAILIVRTWQITGADKEFADDLRTCENKN